MAASIRTTILLTVACLLIWSVPAHARPRHGRIVVVPSVRFHTPYVYDPFWAPYYPYAYGYAPYAYDGYTVPTRADVKIAVTPKEAEVFVDGYYAGVADDFDGALRRLHTTPGGHAITLYLDGYRTITDSIYARPGDTSTLRDVMERLAPGESSAPVPSPEELTAPLH